MRRVLFHAFLALVSASLPAGAEVHRFGLFIGVDAGLGVDPALKFASRDAEEMAAVFRQSGLYAQDQILLLSNGSLEKVRQEMKVVESTLTTWRKQGDQANLIVYFSGHGDAQSLHIQGEKLQREDLVAWLNGLACDLKILVLDACESGNFLRSKGGRYLEDLPVQVQDNLKSRGVIIVSSTSRGELAQESDDYRGAVFTHHLLNGLKGLADYNGDGWVGLQESFEYSRRATAMDMALGGSLRQNPSFDLDLVGGSDPGLVPVDHRKSWMRLRNFPVGSLDIYDANSLDRVTRVWLTGADSLSYRIPTGSYLFRFHEGGKEYLHTHVVGRVGGEEIDRKNFQEKVRWSWISKGGAPKVRLNGLQTSFGAPHPFPGLSLGMARFEYVTRTAAAKQAVSFGFGRGRASDSATRLSNDMQLFHLGYAWTPFVAGSRRVRLFVGGMAGLNFARQTLTDLRYGGLDMPTNLGVRPARTTRWARVYQVGAPFDLEWAVYGPLWVSGEALYSVYGYTDAGRDRFRVRLALEPFLKLGMHF
jgi:hypothetical protein